MVKKIRILFVCRYNRFRSRIALAYFNKINKNKNIKAKSAGLIKGSVVSGRGVGVAKKLGLNIKGKAQGLTDTLMHWHNIAVIVADNVPKKVFYSNKKQGKKLIVWKIKDVNREKGRTDEEVIEDIIKKVDAFNKKLKKLK
jgi:protein-tyrosine-phosphatase